MYIRVSDFLWFPLCYEGSKTRSIRGAVYPLGRVSELNCDMATVME